MSGLHVLDLFSGKGGFAAAFRDRGHNVVTLDLGEEFGCDYTMDIMDFMVKDYTEERGVPDVVLSGPPCEAFSVASIGHHWGGGHRAYEPKTRHAQLSQDIVLQTVDIILEFSVHNPRLCGLIENPVGVLRKLDLIPRNWAHEKVWQCRFGNMAAKPTDLWYTGPWVNDDTFRWTEAAAKAVGKPWWECQNGGRGGGAVEVGGVVWRTDENGNPCHQQAQRGARSGTQGKAGAAERAVVAYGLSLYLCKQAEAALATRIGA